MLRPFFHSAVRLLAASRSSAPYAKRRRRSLPVFRLKGELLEQRRLLSASEIPQSGFGLLAPIVAPTAEETRLAPFRPEVVRVDGRGSGTFITRQHILTAAHVVDSNGDFRFDPSQDGPITITTSNDADLRKPGATTYRVVAVSVHPQYRRNENDLAILQLETLVDTVMPVRINRLAPREEQVLEILGFGKTGVRGGPLQDNGQVRHQSFIMIEDVEPRTFSWDMDQGHEGGIAPGDSGGPTFAADSSGERRLVGVHRGGWSNEFPTQRGATFFDTRVDAHASWIDSVLGSDRSGPTAEVLRLSNITTPGDTQTNIQIRYSDANGIRETDAHRPHIALLGPNNYYNQSPQIGLVTRSTDGAFLTIDYFFRGPGGAGGAADNGEYRVVLLNRGLTDRLGNPTGSTTLASFRVDLPPDSTRPTGRSDAVSITSSGRPSLLHTIRYTDDFGIDASTLGNDDVQLVRSNGSVVSNGRLMTANTIRDRTSLSIPYEFPAPGGAWDPADNGTYSIVVRNGAVRDVSGNTILGATLGAVTVNIASSSIAPWATLSTANITAEASTYTFTITYRDDGAVRASSINPQGVFLSSRGGEVATLVNISPNGDASQIVATYSFRGSRWTSADNGLLVQVMLFGADVTDNAGNRIAPGDLGVIQVRIGPAPNQTAPRAMLNAPPVTLAGSQRHLLTLAVTDDELVEATTIRSDSLFVLGPGGQEYALQLNDINYGQNMPTVLGTYAIEPPGASWDPSDNGRYRIVVRDGTISDINGNFLPGHSTVVPPGEELGSFVVDISTETEPPPVEAVLVVSDVTAPTAAHTFTVTYSDPAGIDVSSLGNDDIYVTNDQGFLQFAELVMVDVNTNGTPRRATYRVIGPGGGWSEDDNGTYEIHVAGAEGPTVQSVDGKHVLPGLLGAFQAAVIPPPLLPELDVRGGDQTIVDGSVTPSAANRTLFGSASLAGATIVYTFTIANTGTGTLTLSGNPLIQISGAGAGDFTVTSLPDNSVAAGGSTTFQITFDPSAAGMRTATITIANNDSDENPFDFVIQGSGEAAAEIDVLGNGISILDGDTSPWPVDLTDFGIAGVGSGTQVRTFTIANLGGATLNLTGSPVIQIGGPNAADFSVRALPSATVNAGGTSTFQVAFTPAAAGLRMATVSILSNDADESPYDFSILGIGDSDVGDILADALVTDLVDSGSRSFQEFIGNGSRLRADVDLYRFHAQAGGRLTASTTFVSGGLPFDSYLRLFDAGGAMLAADDDSGAGLYSQIADFTLPATGVYYLGVSGYANIFYHPVTGFGSRPAEIGDYRLLVDLAASLPTPFPEIDVQGSGLSIASGDLTASLADGTDFGSVILGGFTSHSFTLVNTGLGVLHLSGTPRIRITGAAASDFSVSLLPTELATDSSISFQLVFNPSAAGTRTAIVTIANDDPDESEYTFAIRGTGAPAAVPAVLVTGAGSGGGPHVRVMDAATLQERLSFFAYDTRFTGGVRVATADVSGDGVPDIITAPGAGERPHVRVFDGLTGEQLPGPIGSFLAYDSGFTGGVFVAARDVNGDGRADVITAAGAGGGPHVRVFSGLDGSELYGFLAYGAGFTGGVSVAADDVNGDGRADIITGAGAGGGPHVRVFSGATGAPLPGAIGGFFAYGAGFTGGVFVAAGDVNADGMADVITGAGAGGGPHVRVFSGANATVLQSFFAYALSFTGGVHVAAADINGDGRPDIVTTPGAGGGPHVRAFSGVDRSSLASFLAYDASFSGGVFASAAPSASAPSSSIRRIVDRTGPISGSIDQQQQSELIRSAAFTDWEEDEPNSYENNGADSWVREALDPGVGRFAGSQLADSLFSRW